MDSEIFEKDDTNPLGYRIKRISAPQIEHKSRLLIPGSNRIIIMGASGRGKSTVALEIIPMFSNKTTHLIIGSVKPQDDAFDAIQKYCEFSKIKYILLDNPTDVAGAIEEIVNKKKPLDHYIVIFDDLATSYSATSKDAANQMITTAYSILRSTNGSLIMITQSYNSIPTRVRLNCNLKIAFGMDDVFSSRALITDTVGMFFNGHNEKEVKNDIKKIYQTLYDDFHNWILITNNPPEIRKKWNNIAYPPEKIGIIKGGTKKEKKDIPPNCRIKFTLYKEALELGFPKWAYHNATPKILREYIENKKNGGKLLDDDIISKDCVDNPIRLRRQLIYYIKKFKLTDNPKQLKRVVDICEKINDINAMTSKQLNYILKNNDMLKYIDVE